MKFLDSVVFVFKLIMDTYFINNGIKGIIWTRDCSLGIQKKIIVNTIDFFFFDKIKTIEIKLYKHHIL